MVQEAEKYKEDDKKIKDNIDAKNELESIIYQTKSSIDKEEVKEKLSDEEIQTLTDLVVDNEKWLEENSEATTEELNSQKDLFNTTVQPIMSKLYQNPSGGMPEGMPEENSDEMPDTSGPTIDGFELIINN